ncbi:MAG: hypothetical protein ACE145_17995 [Terriglobia bacterium]
MPSFSGKFRYLNTDGTATQSGPCQVSFEAETLTLVPQAGAPIVFDLGDIDSFAAGEYELTLTLYTGKKILLHQFGKSFQNLTHDLLDAYRARLVQCLLLEDLEELTRFEGVAQLESPGRAFTSPAEFRLYKSNLAVLPAAATGFQWRLAEIDSLRFDEAGYAVILEASGERLLVTKLAKRTREFVERLREATAQLTENSALTVHKLFPFLSPDQFQSAAEVMKEGRAAPLAKLQAVHPRIEQALTENIVDAKLRPYFDALMKRVPAGFLYTGFKLIRKQEEASGPEIKEPAAAEESGASTEAFEPEDSAEEAAEKTAGDQNEEQPILHWFFFPLATTAGAAQPGNLVAWEATSKSGRATYFFRLLPPEQAGSLADSAKAPAAVEAAIQQLNRALVLLNFRREPIYLSDDKLEMQPRYRRYAIACRKLPDLRRLRASFLGRALHASPVSWQKQVDQMLAAAK